jgi:hypothetical protein
VYSKRSNLKDTPQDEPRLGHLREIAMPYQNDVRQSHGDLVCSAGNIEVRGASIMADFLRFKEVQGRASVTYPVRDTHMIWVRAWQYQLRHRSSRH